MTYFYIAILLALLVGTYFGIQKYKQLEEERFVAASKLAIHDLASNLKQELLSAIQEGGIAKAIDTCKLRAPIITQNTSTRFLLEVRRTSLKWRNPDNSPDEWERKILTQFSQRAASGESLTMLNATEITYASGKGTYRYMQAIPMQEICLNCHGDKNMLPPAVVNVLHTSYPNDNATGFSVGDIRGAFSVSQIMDN